MKRIFSLLLSVVMLISITAGLDLSVHAQTSGDWEYSTSFGEATITGYTGDASSLIVPSAIGGYSVTSIGNRAFNGCEKLVSITIADSVSSISSEAFVNCDNLNEIMLGTNVESFDYYSALSCNKLSYIHVKNGNEFLSSDNGVLFNKNKTELIRYPNGNSRKSYTLPSSVKTIDVQAFQGCRNLTSVTIPEGVTNIEDNAFYMCTNLSSINIPESVISIGDDAFKETAYFNNQSNWEDNALYLDGCLLYTYSNKMQQHKIKEGTRLISEFAFNMCGDLTLVIFPESLTSISHGSIYWCSNLEKVIIPDSVTHIGSDAIMECHNLTDIYYGGSEEDWNNIIIDAEYNDANEYLDNVTIHYNSSCAKGVHNISVNSTGAESCTECGLITNPSPLIATLSKTSYTYDGNEKNPTVTVKDADGNTLKNGTDYTVTYDSGRTNAGTYNVTVNYKGEYSGSTKLSFVITQQIPDRCTPALSKTSYTYDGNEKNPTVKITDVVGNVLKKDVDYTLTYDEGRTDVGTYNVNIAYKGNYSGTDTLSFKVIQQIPSRCTAKLSDTTYIFDGNQKTPSVTITDVVGNILKNGTDYTLTYDSGRTNAGTYSVKITYKGNYSGTDTLSFRIIDPSIENLTATLSKTSYTYDGNQKNPTVTIKDTQGNVLINGTDYTLSYDAGRTNVGTYDVKITYQGYYTGTDTLSFKVIQQIPSRCTPKLSKTSYTYDGNEKNPTVTIKDVVNNVLVKGRDYTLAYDSGRTNAGTYNVKITYKGNYSGTDTVSFKVIQQIPSRCTATLSTTATYYNGSVKTPGVTVKDVVNNTLKNGRDYTVTMDAGRKNVGRYAVKITYKGNYSGSQTLYFNIIPRGITNIKSVSARSKGFTVQWPTQTTQTTGYQIQYSTSSSFKNAKTITMPKSTYYAKRVTGLTANKRYYVRIRTYKTTKFNGKNYNVYSFWCATKSVVTGK